MAPYEVVDFHPGKPQLHCNTISYFLITTTVSQSVYYGSVSVSALTLRSSGGPAEQCGEIKIGDVLLSIDDMRVGSLPIGKAINIM